VGASSLAPCAISRCLPTDCMGGKRSRIFISALHVPTPARSQRSSASPARTAGSSPRSTRREHPAHRPATRAELTPRLRQHVQCDHARDRARARPRVPEVRPAARRVQPARVRAPPRERAREVVIDRARSGGFFAGKVPSEAATAELEAGSRFAGASAMAQLYRGRYVRGGYFRALELVKAAAVRRDRPRRAPRCAGC
jgi:hypothetical protein